MRKTGKVYLGHNARVTDGHDERVIENPVTPLSVSGESMMHGNSKIQIQGRLKRVGQPYVNTITRGSDRGHWSYGGAC